jgi:hypothetical protein
MDKPTFTMDTEDELPTTDELSDIAALAARQLELLASIDKMQTALTEEIENLRQVQEVALPAAMATVGMSKFTLTSGESISIKETMQASIYVDKIEAAVKWLDTIGCGGVVKDEVKCSLGRGETSKAKELLDLARILGVAATEKLSVHPSTLKALIKEQRARGVQFPDDLFSIMDKKQAVIKTKP